ncbi:AAA family ATPase [Streptosporangium sp. NPDC051022]|uniref:AAA family ATPase n=1 Tax=Streptosporangium sp. NPDC051022 TaxID=3155752 RepID=UPI003419459C
MTSCPRCGARIISLSYKVEGYGSFDACAGCSKKPEHCTCEPSEKTVPAEPFTRRRKLTRASEITIKPVVWMWEEEGAGRIPSGSLVVAAGREGTGKSSFGIWQTAGVTTGTLPGTLYGKPYDVIYVAVEDSWEHTIAGRLKAAGADLNRVWRLDVEVSEDEFSTINLPYDFDILEEVIVEYDVKLVVLDPLISTIGASIDTHKERSVRTVLDPLARMADRTRCTMLGIAHFNKGAGSDPSSLITASGAFKNVPRAIFGFAVDPEDGSRVMTQTKNSLGRLDLPSLAYNIESAKILTDTGEYAEVGKFVFCGESPRSVQDILSAGSSEGDQLQDKADAADYLRKALAGRWRRSNEIKEEAREVHGISARTLERARRAVAVHADQFPTDPRGKNEWWITLPEQVATLPKPKKQTATESQSEEQTATVTSLTRADRQTANQTDASELWRSGGLPLDPEPLNDSPEPVADVVPIKRTRNVRPRCGWCKKAFTPARNAAYCSKNCRQNASRASKKGAK